MTRHPKPELISAFVDNELRGNDVRTVKDHLSHCPICAAEYRHVVHVRRMLQENPPQVDMTDSHDFFWHKVRSEIEASDNKVEQVIMPRLSIADWFSQHQTAVTRFVSATALIVVTLVALGVSQRMFRSGDNQPQTVAVAVTAPEISDVNTPLVPHSVASVLESPRSDRSDVTVIWVSGLPWVKDMTELQTVTANPYYYLDI
jgi:anti-sigma factor RsiW